jgi:uncharacterized protein YccT (UPF0319 family)
MYLVKKQSKATTKSKNKNNKNKKKNTLPSKKANKKATKKNQTNKTSKIDQQTNEIKKPQEVISKEGLDTGVVFLDILIGLDTIYKYIIYLD